MPENLPNDTINKNTLQIYQIPILVAGLGILLVILGVRFLFFQPQSEIEFIEQTPEQEQAAQVLSVDVSGAVEKPGVYKLSSNSRIQDALVEAGGLSYEADRDWVAKHTNLAAKLIDGTKVYIPSKEEVNQTRADPNQILSSIVSVQGININTASEAELDQLPGIGEVTAQKIINQRPYTEINELLSKKIVNQSTFNKIKEQIFVY